MPVFLYWVVQRVILENSMNQVLLNSVVVVLYTIRIVVVVVVKQQRHLHCLAFQLLFLLQSHLFGDLFQSLVTLGRSYIINRINLPVGRLVSLCCCAAAAAAAAACAAAAALRCCLLLPAAAAAAKTE